MANLSKLSSLGGLVVAGAALGLYLGSSAISEINPAYYSTPLSASKFHTDLVPNQGTRDSAAPLPELAAVAADLGPSCVSCSLALDEYAPIGYRAADGYGSDRPVPPEVVLARADEYVARGLSPGEVRDIERYAHFRVSDDDGEAALSVAAKSKREGGDADATEPDEEAAPGI